MSTRATGIVTLLAGQSQLSVCPGIGGSVVAFTWRDQTILRPTAEEAVAQRAVRQMSSYPLVPYSNRIGNGLLRFRGETFKLEPVFAPEPHVIHGVGWRHAWSVLDQASNALLLELTHPGNGEWPYRFAARQAFALSDGRLEVTISLENRDSLAMPAGLGFHPFFPLSPDVTLEATWAGGWANGPNKLPVQWEPLANDEDFRSHRRIGDWTVDRCFTGWNRVATLNYGSRRVTITGSETFGNMVCYVPGGGNFIALEPVSNVNDAFALAARGASDTGMRVLEPGDSLEGRMTITVEANS